MVLEKNMVYRERLSLEWLVPLEARRGKEGCSRSLGRSMTLWYPEFNL